MLLAYIDEVGEPGAYVSPEHPRYKTSAAFGYAGFVVPEDGARSIGARFDRKKRELFSTELVTIDNPARWERKGAQIFRPSTPLKYPQQLRAFTGLLRAIQQCSGHLFYYADEKRVGTPRQVKVDPGERESHAMNETLNRLARYADAQDQNILVMIDQADEKVRLSRIAQMYAHMFSRTAEHPEMKRIIEPPMHVDSKLSANIQLADWIAAYISRAIDFQLVRTSKHRWVTEVIDQRTLTRMFTSNSKLHFYERDLPDLNYSEIFRHYRPLHPTPGGHTIASSIDPDVARKIERVRNAIGSRVGNQAPRNAG